MLLAGSAPDSPSAAPDSSSADPHSPSVAAIRLLQIIEYEFRDGLENARPALAAGPRPDTESLRAAYLELLKLCLCDLVGTSTTSVVRTGEGLVMSRELAGEQLRLRAAGMDWPLHGLTMVGLRRLDDLQSCVESIVRDGVSGDLIEAGSWRGGASLFMRATLDTLEESERTVWVTDSFQGFPQAEGSEGDGYDLSADLAGCDFLAVPLEEVKDTFTRLGCERGVRFVPGFFEDTLPGLARRTWSLIRLDGDTYESVRIAMEALYPGLAAGGYLIVDDYGSLDQCREAIDDFRREHRITEPIEEVDWSCVRWRRDEGPITLAAPTISAAPKRPAVQPVPRPPRTRVPAIEEVALNEEIERLRHRLSDAEAEIERLVSSPVAGAREWLERRRAARRSAS